MFQINNGTYSTLTKLEFVTRCNMCLCELKQATYLQTILALNNVWKNESSY